LLGFTATPLLSQGKTIVIGRVGACGAVNVVETPCWISDNAMYVSQWHTDCDIEYIALALRSIDLSRLAKKGAQPSISQEAVYSALIPLPPLEEQRRIVARIEELMGRVREARRLRQESQKGAERLWQSVLAQTFPRPGSDLPEGWRWVRLEEVCEIWDSLRKPVKKKYRHPGNVPYCGANGVIDYVDGFTHFGEFVLLAEDGGFYGPGEFSAYMMKGRFWANNHVHILRGKPDQLLNHLLYHWLVTCDLRPFLTGATRPKLTQGAMRSILIPLPPLAEQRRIVAHLEAVQERLKALKEAQAATEAELKRLEQAILEKAFRGEL
jgi:type I restriction enzyme S subunit